MEKRTSLYDEHLKACARVVPFAGFLMPIQYSGILDEHRAVRTAMGLFDLSHMGELRVSGSGSAEAIDRLVTNDIADLQEWQIRYTPMCYPNAGIVDDLLVYRFLDHLMLVVNASNIDKDLEWIRQHVPADVKVENVSDATALIAVQGPRAEALVQEMTESDLSSVSYYHFTQSRIAGLKAIVSRTGYTGEDGFELYLDPKDAPVVWQLLLEKGRPGGLIPIGLGARDTLRLEAGYMLYGNDIDDSTTPLEAGLGWTVKFLDSDFVGRAALEQQKSDGLTRRMVAVDMRDRAIPRPHFPILADGEPVGEITSGTFSPTFEHGIGLGYVATAHAKNGASIEVDVRKQRHPAQVVKKPMYKREGV